MWYPPPRVLPDASRNVSLPPFRHRAFSRRSLLRSAAAASALTLGAGLTAPLITSVAASNDEAMPIPGGNDFLGDGHFVHVYIPGFGAENVTVNNFSGFVASAEIRGSGTGTDTTSGKTTRYYYDADMRFMDGDYIAADGRIRHGTFGFV